MNHSMDDKINVLAEGLLQAAEAACKENGGDKAIVIGALHMAATKAIFRYGESDEQCRRALKIMSDTGQQALEDMIAGGTGALQ